MRSEKARQLIDLGLNISQILEKIECLSRDVRELKAAISLAPEQKPQREKPKEKINPADLLNF